MTRTTWLLLAGLTALGAALRLHGLDAQSLWNDELASITTSQLPTVGQVYWYAGGPQHLPAYFVGLRYWLHLAGDSAVAARLPSALCGIATVPAMFALGRRWFGPVEGLIAAGLTAVLVVPLHFSQEARPYAVLLLAVTLSTAWLTDVVGALRRGDRLPRGAAVGVAIAAIAASQVHLFGTLFVVLQAGTAALLLWPRRRALGRLAAIYAVVAAAFLPAAFRLLRIAPREPDWLAPPGAAAAWELVRFLFNGSTALAVAAVLLWTVAIRRAAGAASAAGAVTTWLAVAWVAVPVAIVLAWSHWRAPAFLPHALIIVLPAAYLLAARGLAQAALPPPLRSALAAALLAALLLDLVTVRRYYTRPFKTQFREAAAYLVAHDDRMPAVVLACSWNRRYFDYYLRRLGSARRVDAVIRRPAEAAAPLPPIIARPPAQLWLLAGHIPCPAELLAALRAVMTPVDERHFERAAVWRFEAPRQPGGAG